MLTNRHRGLVRLHGGAVVLIVALFFWFYAEFIMRFVPVVRLSREVNLLPYFLCVLLGLLAGGGRLRAVEAHLTRLSGLAAVGLATTQIFYVALAVFSMMFATQDRSISRLFLGTFLGGSWLGLTWLHQVLPRSLTRLLYRQTTGIPTLFIGRAELLPQLADWLAQRMQLGLQPVGFISLDPLAPPASLHAAVPFAGQLTELPRVLSEKNISQVILLELPASTVVARQIIADCQLRGCRLLVQHQVDQLLGHPVESVDEGGHHFFTLHYEPLEEPVNRVLKRTFDLMVALPVVCLILPPVMLVVWLGQRWQAPGPLFHTRLRTGGRHGEFAMLKFRSMHVAPIEAKAEAQQASADDPRIYPLGRFLRRHSLDELPQFWHVLMGSMSVVGPRPVMPLLDEEFARQVQAYRSKHWVKPGITGLAQSGGFRGEIKTTAELQERIRLDLYYIANWSFWLDVQITLKTAAQLIFPPSSAY